MVFAIVALVVSIGGPVVSADTHDETPDETASDRQILPTTTLADDDDTTTTSSDFETTTTTEFVETTTTESQGPGTTAGSGEIDGFDDDTSFEDDDDTGSDEDSTTTTSTSTTALALLVPGDGSEGSQSTTTTSTTVVEVASAGVDGLSESTIIWLIVAGLVVIAGLIALWTLRFWRATRPAPPSTTRKGAAADRTTVFRNG